jgi:hypothetical protein
MNTDVMARRKKAKKRFFTRGYHQCCGEQERPLAMATGAFDVGPVVNEDDVTDGRFGAVLPTVEDNEIGEGEQAAA